MLQAADHNSPQRNVVAYAWGKDFCNHTTWRVTVTLTIWDQFHQAKSKSPDREVTLSEFFEEVQTI